MVSCSKAPAQQETLKPRLVVLTDISPVQMEPDDFESMVRLMAHADLFEVEAIITNSSWSSSGGTLPEEWKENIYTVIDNYEKDLPNLQKRSDQTSFRSIDEENGTQTIGYWPSADYLRSRVFSGSRYFGVDKLGEDNNTEGSDFLISLADEDDPRPIFVGAWGGANTFAQAVWKVSQTRREEDVKKFLSKFVLYTVTDQDVPLFFPRPGQKPGDRPEIKSSHVWLRENWQDDFTFIWDESAWMSQNELGRNSWDQYAENIQGHGNLGKIYPKYHFGVEGDTPSYLYCLPNGLNDPTDPTQGSWGGTWKWMLSRDGHTWCYTNFEGDIKAASRKWEEYFYPAIFNNFAARMDWAAEGKGNRNPVVMLNGTAGLEVLKLDARPGDQVKLSAKGTYDPEQDEMDIKWMKMDPASSYTGEVTITPKGQNAVVSVPEDASGKTIHVVCEVTDKGTPALTSYRRAIIQVVE